MAEAASDWGFVKLLISLDTAVAGAVIYGQEHILKRPHSKWLVIASVALLVLSLQASLGAAIDLIRIDAIREEDKRTDGALPASIQDMLRQRAKRFTWEINAGRICFSLGVIAAFVFFIWNLW